jgi:hypothetical protein
MSTAEETWGMDWSSEEVEAFKELYITHGKDFRAIAQHLPQRTPAEAMMFYYRYDPGKLGVALARCSVFFIVMLGDRGG